MPSRLLPIEARLAMRELRGGLRGFRIFLACLILGVAAIAGVGSLSRAIIAGLDARGAELLAGDIEVRLYRRDINAEHRAFLEQVGEVARVARLRTNLRTESGTAAVAELKAVEPGYPFYGGLVLSKPGPLQPMLARQDGLWGAVADEALADRLGLALGDVVRVGETQVQLRAWLEREPDRSNQGWQLGPSLMVAPGALQAADLLGTGSLVNYYYKIKLPPGANLQDVRRRIQDAYPDMDWSVRDRSRAAQGVRSFIDQFGTFLVLVGLTALVVGGAGVSNAVRSYLDTRRETIATFKVLGADGGLIFRLYFLQVLALALAAVIIGLSLGAGLPFAFSGTLSDRLPVPPEIGLYPAPLISAGIYGVMIAIAFSVWPLGRARDLRPAILLRVGGEAMAQWPRALYVGTAVAAVAAVVIAAITLSEIPGVAAGFLAGAGASLGLLWLAGQGIERLAARLPKPRRPVWRIAIANLYRPRAATGAVVMSLGLGLTLFATLTLVETNLGQQIDETIPEQAPAYYFLDIQHFEKDGFIDTLDRVDGVTDVEVAPWVRARITHLDGIAPQDADVASDVRWLLRGDRQMSYQAAFPEDNRLVAGRWWPADYSGSPKLSISLEHARGLGLEVGDSVGLNILGRDFEAEVMSLRAIDWAGFAFNFIFLIDPSTVAGAPHTWLAKIETADAEAAEAAYQAVVANYPAVTAVPVRTILQDAQNLLRELGLAIRATAAVTIAAGVLVLAGAIAAGHRRRVYDAAVFKIIGATRRDILTAFALEYLILGAVTGLIALVLGGIAGWAVVTQVMELPFSLTPLAVAGTLLVSLVLTIGFGLVGSWRALKVRPARLLRTA